MKFYTSLLVFLAGSKLSAGEGLRGSESSGLSTSNHPSDFHLISRVFKDMFMDSPNLNPSIETSDKEAGTKEISCVDSTGHKAVAKEAHDDLHSISVCDENGGCLEFLRPDNPTVRVFQNDASDIFQTYNVLAGFFPKNSCQMSPTAVIRNDVTKNAIILLCSDERTGRHAAALELEDESALSGFSLCKGDFCSAINDDIGFFGKRN